MEQILTYFSKLNEIPRGSFNLDGVRNFLERWAIDNDFYYKRDTYGNVVISKMNNLEYSGEMIKNNVIIQAHMDMVVTKTKESKHNFKTDKIINLIKKDDQGRDIMYAEGTTLGADNGIGLTAAMTLFEKYKNDKSINLYCLFTADEEVGLQGAENIDPYPFLPNNAYVINVDSEYPHEICAGSAGGSICKLKYNLPQISQIPSKNYPIYTLELTGLKGGHSGIDINKGRANAIKILIQLLKSLDVNVVKFEGGNATNAIAIYAKAQFTRKYNETANDEFFSKVNDLVSSLRSRYNEPNLSYNLIKHVNLDEDPYGDINIHKMYDMNNIIEFLHILHTGIITMNPYNNDCVETSTNIGIVRIDDDTQDVYIEIMTRSGSIETMKEYHTVIETLAKIYRIKVDDVMFRTGWAPNWNKSNTLAQIKKAHDLLFGSDPAKIYSKPRVYSVHAGLECGNLMNRYPNWDIMSIGPEIHGAHTYDECIVLESIQPFYDWLDKTVELLINQ